MSASTFSVNDLMNMDIPPETAEQAYRRAYRDGYIIALQDVFGNQEIPPKFWQHWQTTLLEWEEGDTSQIQWPPSLAS